MTFQLIILIALGVAALAIAAYAVIADRQRRQVIARTLVRNDLPQVSGAIFRGAGLPASSLRARLMALAPSGWRSDVKARDKLVQAGFDDPVAPLAYATARLVLLVAFPTVAALIVVGKPLPQMIVALLPVIIFVAMMYIVPDFARSFVDSRTGQFMLAAATASVVMGYMIMMKIADVDF